MVEKKNETERRVLVLFRLSKLDRKPKDRN